MQLSIQKRKHQQWKHLQHQYKLYKKNYQGRPLIPKQISTYLQFTNFITRLIPTINQHYFQALTNSENSYISQLIAAMFSDLESKIKNLANRIEKQEIEQNNSKYVKTMCKVCLHELRAAQIQQAKKALEGNETFAFNILKMIRQVEQTSQPFTVDQDRKFFFELRAALKKKEEVIQLCQNESMEFMTMIDEQLKDLLMNKNNLIFPEEKHSKQPQMKGYQLKQNVMKSLEVHLNQKIPQIIKLIQTSLRKWEQKQRKLRAVHAEVQTIDAENIKFMEIKRKMATIQTQLNHSNIQKNKLMWTLQQKTLSIQKYEKELASLHNELNEKTYDLQKQIRNLEQKNKRYKQQFQKQKSRRTLDYSQQNFKTINSFAQLKQPSFAQEPQEQPQLQPQQARVQKKKKTIASNIKSNGKFFLPTLKKISSESGQLNGFRNSVKNSFQNQQVSIMQNTTNNNIENLTKTNKELNENNFKGQTLISSTKVSLSKNKMQVQYKDQKGQSKRKMERLLTVANAKDTIKQNDILKSSYKNVRTQRFTEGNQALNSSNPLPSINQRQKNYNLSKKSKNELNNINSSLNKRQKTRNNLQIQQKQIQFQQIKKQARQVNQKLKERITQRSRTSLSSNSNKSGIRNSNRIPRQSIYKQQNREQVLSSNQQRSLSNKKNAEDSSFLAQAKLQKHYLKNSYSKINEQIDKQSYMTPIIQVESLQAKELQKIQENKTVKHHLFNIYQQISKQSQVNKNFTMEKFSQIFQSYVGKINQIKRHSPLQTTQNIGNIQLNNPIYEVSGNIAIQESKNKEKINIQDENKKQTKQIIQARSLCLNENRIYAMTLNLNDSQFATITNRMKNSQHLQQESKYKPQLHSIKHSSKGKTKQNSLNASYHLSPAYSEQGSKTSKIRQGHYNSNIHNSFLLHLESILFFNQQIAYRYQTNFSKKNLKAGALTPQLNLYLKELFQIFQNLKNMNVDCYYRISGFLRYPYSHSQNGFLQLDILKNISLNTLTQCFLRILAFHTKCPMEKFVCTHFVNFKKIMANCLQQKL